MVAYGLKELFLIGPTAPGTPDTATSVFIRGTEDVETSPLLTLDPHSAYVFAYLFPFRPGDPRYMLLRNAILPCVCYSSIPVVARSLAEQHDGRPRQRHSA